MKLPIGRQTEIATSAGISRAFLCQLLGGKVYTGHKKPRGASWEVYERLARATKVPPEVWARNIGKRTPQLIVAAILEADRERADQMKPAPSEAAASRAALP